MDITAIVALVVSIGTLGLGYAGLKQKATQQEMTSVSTEMHVLRGRIEECERDRRDMRGEVTRLLDDKRAAHARILALEERLMTLERER